MKNNNFDINKIISSEKILNKKYEEIKWLIKDILPPGLTILAGRPKSGKSFLALNIATKLTISENVFNNYETNKRRILFISNEDSERRIKNRITHSKFEKSNLSFYFESFYFIDGFEEKLKYLIERNKIDLIIVDTLAKALRLSNSTKNQYFVEYETMGKIQDFCRKNNISIILLHHTRKAVAEYVIDSILGTTGMSGAVDTIWLLKKKNGNHILNVEGKDVESRELYLSQQIRGNQWNLINNAYLDITPEREEILKLFTIENREIKTGEIASKLGKNTNSISNILKKMKEEGLVKSKKFGYYYI